MDRHILEHRGYQSGLGQVLGLFCIAFAIFKGLTPWLWATVATYALVGLCITIGFHRLFAHQAFRTSRFWHLVLLIGGTFSCSGSSVQWNIAHLMHHVHSDGPGDPHNIRGWWSAWLINYHYPKYNMNGIRKMLATSPIRKEHIWLHHHYWLINGLVILASLMISWKLCFYGFLLPVGMLLIMGGLHNVLAHWGRTPRNIWWYAPISFGEWNHRNHHDRPREARFGSYDPGWWLIKAIRS